MDDVLDQLTQWQQAGQPVAVATVVKTSGSTPRREGAKLIVRGDGQIAGSVSGGCVEADVTLHALDVLKQGRPRLVPYGISDEMGIEVGLACGGAIEVLIEGETAGDGLSYAGVAELVRQEVPVVVATALRPEGALGRRAVFARGSLSGSLGDAALDTAVAQRAPRLVREGQSGVFAVANSLGEVVDLFLDAYPAPPTLYIFGGVHVGIPLMKFAKIIGYRVHVVDPRGVFATHERFAEADELAITHPSDYLKDVEFNENSSVVVLTHDPKLDEPVLERALPSNATYVGAIGSRKTNRERLARLAARGMQPEHLARLHSPIGLDIGSQVPEEIALAIMAEVLATRYGKSGGSLVSAEPPPPRWRAPDRPQGEGSGTDAIPPPP